MSNRSSTIDRPPRPAADRGRSRLGDLTRPISVDRRISHGRRVNVLLALIAIAIAAAFAVVLFVFPIRTYFDQEQQLDQRRDQVAELQAINADLRREVSRLRTDDGVRESARDQLGYVADGEQRQTITGLPPVPTDLPDGWPYVLVERIVALRRAG